MLVPNLMIFPNVFSSGLEEGAVWEIMLNKKLKWELSGEMDCFQFSANLDVIEGLFKAGAVLLLLSLRLAFVADDVSEDASPSSSFSLSFSSCNTSTWA